MRRILGLMGSGVVLSCKLLYSFAAFAVLIVACAAFWATIEAGERTQYSNYLTYRVAVNQQTELDIARETHALALCNQIELEDTIEKANKQVQFLAESHGRLEGELGKCADRIAQLVDDLAAAQSRADSAERWFKLETAKLGEANVKNFELKAKVKELEELIKELEPDTAGPA